MAFRLRQAGDRVYVGKNSSGDLNVEVWTAAKHNPGAQIEAEVYIPANAVEDLFQFIRHEW